MARTAAPEREGADFRLDPSPFGDKVKRAAWVEKIGKLESLPAALEELITFRRSFQDDSLRDQDVLWIEARLEERVAVLRFEVMSNEEIRTQTLIGGTTADVCAEFIGRAEVASNQPRELERIVKEFRDRYKPPIMMSAPFMRTETVISEILIKARTLDWYGPSIADLRIERGVTVDKGGD